MPDRRPIPTVLPVMAALVGAAILAVPSPVRADHVEGTEMLAPILSPSQSIVHDQRLAISHAGIPNLLYEGNPSFIDGEGLVGTITQVVIIGDGPATAHGTAELLTPPTLTATVPDDWSTSVFAVIQFDELIQVAYTAPSEAVLREVGCSMSVVLRVGVLLDIVGDAGTHATIDLTSELPIAQVSVPTITCPAAAAPTPPRTDTAVGTESGVPDDREGSRAILAIVAVLLLGTTLLASRNWRAGWDSNPRPKD